MLFLQKTPPSGSLPVALPVARGTVDLERVARALAAAAHALSEAANAIAGGFSPNPSEAVGGICLFSEKKTVSETVNEFLIAKAKAGRSDRYLRQLRVSLGSFARGRSQAPLIDITLPEIEKWMFNLDRRSKTMRNYLGDLKTLLNFAIKRGYLRENRALGVELPRVENRPPVIHSPEQVAAVLEYARSVDLDVMRHLAVRYFTGIRTAEAHRVREENILEQYIEVPAAKSKTRRRRLIKIQPALRAWLALGGTLRPIGAMSVRKVLNASKVQWAKNVTRHSFVSYHLAKFQNAAQTALEGGHTEAILFAHYREVVTPEEAERFYKVLPRVI